MKNLYKSIILIIISVLTLSNFAHADLPRYLDFKLVLNESTAGSKAQNFLKKKYEDGVKKLNSQEKKIQEEEKKTIQQKKLISENEYKKKILELRTKVSNLQKERKKLLEEIGKQRAFAKQELLKNLNPLLKEYMIEKKIRLVLDKKDLILADENLDITKDVMERLNKKLKSIKFN